MPSTSHLAAGETSLANLTMLLDTNQDGLISHKEFLTGIRSQEFQQTLKDNSPKSASMNANERKAPPGWKRNGGGWSAFGR